MDILDPSSFAFVTSLTCYPLLLQTLLQKFELIQMKRLTKLMIVMDVFSVVDLNDLRVIYKEIIPWKVGTGGIVQGKRVVLSVKFGGFQQTESELVNLMTNFTGMVKLGNYKILHNISASRR
ncbi:unnamed protein product [Ambrosiozyma monospora]|uniref:Unnamed protein product n=1 Tax=Ambrosiozyma monospora TaxID=43982 RepID=A0ACB5T3C8_AMBMO|nr:unnamed protein product [Ambrosiozyma monospora]